MLIQFTSILVYWHAESTAKWPITATAQHTNTNVTKDNKQGTYETNKQRIKYLNNSSGYLTV